MLLQLSQILVRLMNSVYSFRFGVNERSLILILLFMLPLNKRLLLHKTILYFKLCVALSFRARVPLSKQNEKKKELDKITIVNHGWHHSSRLSRDVYAQSTLSNISVNLNFIRAVRSRLWHKRMEKVFC